MLVSLNWLKKFTELPDDNDLLISKIASQVAEIEEVTYMADKYQGIVVAEIKEAGDHPDADKLGLYKVNNGEDVVQVVAGDKTLKIGDKVAYIAPGLAVPSSFGTDEPFIIEKRKLRGVESVGMMASVKEITWGDNHTEVLVLDTGKPVGTSLIEAYELDDVIIEIENKTLTHRPDCFGMLGFAREVAGVNEIAFKTPDWFKKATKSTKIDTSLPLTVEIKTEDCSRYVGVVMDNVEIKPSPLLLQTYLLRVGIRPVNNVVDVTNYLMVETGQPMHAFDYDKVAQLSKDEPKMIVRLPRKGEKLTLLDGREIEPHENAIIISTDKEVIDLAGAMGGANSEISQETTRIIIESANFDLYSIRRTSMEHGIFSEAVTRFIRGQSPEQCLAVANKAVEMISEVSGGKQASEAIDIYPEPQEKLEINVDAEFINKHLGSDYEGEQMAKALDNVELKTSVYGGNLLVEPPFWRRDLHIEEDIVEEVGRLIGYDKLTPTLPVRDLTPARLDDKQQLIVDARKVMVEAGNNELLTYNFVAQADLERAGLDTKLAFRLRNSISPQLEVLRTALLPSLLDKVHPNIKLGYQEFGLFEINKSHRNNHMEEDLPVEELSLAHVFASSTRVRTEEINGAPYYQAQHVLNYLLDKLQIDWTELVPLTEVDDAWLATRQPTYEVSRTAAVVSDKGVVGVVGEFKPSVKTKYKLTDYIAGFELNLDVLLNLRSSQTKYAAQLKYPGTQKDVTFAVDAKVSARDLLEAIAKEVVAQKNMQNSVVILDIFQKDAKIKNLTYRFELRHKDRTLTTEEANKITDQVVKSVKSQFKAKQV